MVEAAQRRLPVGRVLTLGALSAFGPLSIDLYLPALPRLAGDLTTSQASAQLTLSVCLVGLALGQLLVGPVTDRIGRRRPLLIGVAIFVVAAGLSALAPSIEVLLAVRLLGGLAGGAGIVIARAMVRDHHDGITTARVFALLMLVNGVAPIVAPVLGSQLLRVTDWRGLFGVLALIGLVLLAAAATLPETLPPDRRRPGGFRATLRTLAQVVRDPTFLVPALVMGLGLCGMFTYIGMGSFVLQDGYGLGAQAYGFAFATNALGLVVTSRLSATLVERVGPRVLLAGGVWLALAAAVALLVGALATRSMWAVLPPLFVLVSCTGLIAPNATALALAGQARSAGTASAVIGLLQFAFGAVVPPVASIGGVSALVMGLTMVATAGAAAALHLVMALAERARGGAPA